MNPQQAENLRTLIRHMEVLDRPLNMHRVATHCGTPACAIGEATCIPQFAMELCPSDYGSHVVLQGRAMFYAAAARALFAVEDRLFGDINTNVWRSNSVTPAEWATEARKVLAESGYAMEPHDDGFAAFMAKVREPIAINATV